MSKLIICVAAVVAVAGCTDVQSERKSAKLVGEVSDSEITDDDPGEITLNAENRGNTTRTFIVELYPVGDYDEVARIYNREGDRRNAFRLGEAVAGATTGERFASVRKELNITSDVRIHAELITGENDTEIDSQVFTLRSRED